MVATFDEGIAPSGRRVRRARREGTHGRAAVRHVARAGVHGHRDHRRVHARAGISPSRPASRATSTPSSRRSCSKAPRCSSSPRSVARTRSRRSVPSNRRPPTRPQPTSSPRSSVAPASWQEFADGRRHRDLAVRGVGLGALGDAFVLVQIVRHRARTSAARPAGDGSAIQLMRSTAAPLEKWKFATRSTTRPSCGGGQVARAQTQAARAGSPRRSPTRRRRAGRARAPARRAAARVRGPSVRAASPVSSRSSHDAKPGIGDSVTNRRSCGRSSRNASTTCLISAVPRFTPARPGWQFEIE